jgi:hypothetical protein
MLIPAQIITSILALLRAAQKHFRDLNKKAAELQMSYLEEQEAILLEGNDPKAAKIWKDPQSGRT